MKYKVTLEGVNALRVLVYKLAEGVGLLNKASRSLSSEIQNNQAGAGPHYQEINSLIEEINGIISKIDEPVDSVSESITELADTYEEIIGTPLYSGDYSITATPFSGSSFLRGGSFSAGMGMTGSSSGSGGSFEGMRTGTLPNGEHAVMGNNYERFVSEYYGSGLTEECTRIDGDPVVETIDPADVEGISFTDREMSNSDIFWNMRGYRRLQTANGDSTFAPSYDMAPYAEGMGSMGLPGDPSSASRFVRTAFSLANAVCEDTEEACVTEAFHILDAAAMVQGTVRTAAGGLDITRYSCCVSMETGTYYYKTYWNNQITAVKLSSQLRKAKELTVYALRTRQQILEEN